MNPIRVLIVDEHKPSRALARRVINSAPGIVLVGEAISPFTVRKAVDDSRPDVLALNASSRMYRHFDAISNTTSVPTVQMPKPDLNYYWHSIELHKVQFTKYSADLINSIKNAVENRQQAMPDKSLGNDQSRVKSRVKKIVKSSRIENRAKYENQSELSKRPLDKGPRPKTKTRQGVKRLRVPGDTTTGPPLIVIGVPGGDLDAMRVVLLGLQSQFYFRSRMTGILIAQQVPATLDQQYRDSLNGISLLPVMDATEGQHIQPGKILLAPSGKNIEIVKHRGLYCCHFSNCDNSPGRKPSLDLLFSSLAKNAGGMGIGILLLGVGSEGSEGLSCLRQAGGSILVQENDSCPDAAMPPAAIMNGGAELIVPLNSIATKVAEIISASRS